MITNDMSEIHRSERSDESQIEQGKIEWKPQDGSPMDINRLLTQAANKLLDIIKSSKEMEYVENDELRKLMEGNAELLTQALNWLKEISREPSADKDNVLSFISKARALIDEQRKEIKLLKRIGEDIGDADTRLLHQEKVLDFLRSFSIKISGQFNGGIKIDPEKALQQSLTQRTIQN